MLMRIDTSLFGREPCSSLKMAVVSLAWGELI